MKTISLSLDGAEISNTIDLEANDADELDEVELSDVDSLDVNAGSLDLNEQKSDDGTLNNFVVTKKMNSENHDSDNGNESTNSLDEQLSDEQLSDDNSDEVQNDTEDEEEDTQVISSINYSKLSKAQLKQLAQEKGLAGYNKLTKGGLVDLLSAAP